jgi:hypothetical protein
MTVRLSEIGNKKECGEQWLEGIGIVHDAQEALGAAVGDQNISLRLCKEDDVSRRPGNLPRALDANGKAGSGKFQFVLRGINQKLQIA